MKRFFVSCAVLLLLAAVVGEASAGVSIYGLSGLIETPDDVTVDPSAVVLMGRDAPDYNDSDVDVYTYGGATGIIPKLEVGVVGLDTDAPGSKTQAVFSAKYRILDETADRPSITIGVVDIGSRMDKINADIDNPSAFVVLGRSLSSVAQPWAAAVTTPLKFTVGVGTGLYKGVFVGLDWSPQNRLHVMAEYLTKGLRQEGTFNAGLRYNAFGRLNLEAGTMAFKGFYGGATYTLLMY
ncbi:MAG: hypothetical protein QHI38_10500 [Armatimonadota bacterium]|nr:hypothetical protein [Armatimonadota bacterium]